MEDWKKLKRDCGITTAISFLVINIYVVLYTIFYGSGKLANALLKLYGMAICTPAAVIFLFAGVMFVVMVIGDVFDDVFD